MAEKKEAMIQEVEMTEEENKGMMHAFEDDILGGLLAAAGYKEDEDSIAPIEIIRNGRVAFKFRVRPLSEDEYQKCKEKNTKYVRNKQLGIKMPEDTNSVRYRSALIYAATIDEDKANIWDNKEAWKALNVITGSDLIEKTLKAGEKDAILEKIDQISGYSMNLVEVAKN